MRSIVDLLGHLRSQKVSLSLDGESLKCSAPPGVLTPELRQELGSRKPEIIAFLRASREALRSNEPGLVPIVPIGRSGPLPLSFAQRRLWFLYQLDPNSAVNNVGAALRIEGHLDLSAVDRAFAMIVQRHEDLRTTFVQVQGDPQTVIGDGRDWKLQIADVSHLSDNAPDSELPKYAARVTQELFDITRGPLFRANLLIVGPHKYVLVVTMHHIISDGWSMGVFVREFAELYRAYAEGREPSLPPLAIQYVDFANWQRTWLESGELAHQLPYWKKQLSGAPPLLGFPTDHHRPQTELFRGRRSKMIVSRELLAGLEQLSHRYDATLFMTLLAAFKILLARYTGQRDIILGSPSANRSRAELSPLIGFFVNNLVLRTDLSGNPSFIELLKRVREVTLRAYEHQDVPFDQLVHALRPERSLDHSPLFQVMFILQNFPFDDLKLDGLVIAPMELEVETARYDLTVEVFPREGELHMYFDYNTDLYEPASMDRIQQHYAAILAAVVANPEQKLDDIPLLSAAEQQKLLVDWNQTESDIPADLCFHEQVEAHAHAAPDRVAVMAGEDSLTYRELDERASLLASSLRSRGAGPETLVAIFLERSVDLVVSLLAVAKSGAAYVPLDPIYPKGRIANIFDEAKPLVVLTTRHLLPALPASSSETLCLDELDASAPHAAQAPSRATQPPSKVTQQNLAYVIFTSGSTGKPKGVQITHRSLLNFLESMQREPGFTADDVLLAVTTVSFDIAALELLLPLYTGATVCVALEPRDPERLLADIGRYRPTVMQATPATWKLLISAGWKGHSGFKVLCGGEALDSGLARSLLVRSGNLWNMYGPTETTIWSAVLRVEEVEATGIPVGRPIRNTSFYVLDPSGNPVPQGVPGELWIGGEGLARGYLNRPDLTNERFLPSPFAALSSHTTGVSHARLYRTGDQVRYRPDGTLDFFGRIDHQVKLRGFRIELAEIENTLRSYPGILDSVTILHDGQGDQRLVGYLAVSDVESLSVPALRDYLRETLPEYMIPAAFVFLKELPRLPNGKLDRTTLPAPENFAGERTGQANVASTSAASASLDTTGKLADIWRIVLKTPKVGIHDNFFSLGGHSLLILQLQSLIRRQFSREVSIPDLFARPTIAALAELLDSPEKPAEALTNGHHRRLREQREASDNSAQPKSVPELAALLLDPGGNSTLNGNGTATRPAPFHSPADIPAADFPATPDSDIWHIREHQPGYCLVRARPGGTRLPIFLVAGFQGPADTILLLSRLIPYLRADQPVYGFRPRWIEGREWYSSVEEEAREYLTELRAVQPHGPYLLGGYCLGGVVAFEMATQLLAQGEQIALLALIDTERPNRVRPAAVTICSGLRRTQHMTSVIRDALRFNDPARSKPARNLIRSKIGMGGAKPEENAHEASYHQLKRYQAIVREYAPQQYPGRITLFVNGQVHRSDRRLGWHQIPIGGLVIRKVSGDHTSMFTEHGKELARFLTESIDGANLEKACQPEALHNSSR